VHKAKGVSKSHGVSYRKGWSPSPFPVVMVVTKGSPEVGMANVETSLQRLPHPWKPIGLLNSQGAD
jgi:hypothetical protein